MRAFELAAGMGARWLELDTQLAACGTPVVIHDERLDRTTDGQGRVDAHSYAQIARLDAGGWFEDRFRGARVPSLVEVLNLARHRSLGLNIELKTDDVHAVVTARAAAGVIDTHGQGLELLISSFSPLALMEMRRLRPDLPLGLLRGRNQHRWRAMATATEARTVNIASANASYSRLAGIHATGRKVLAYTVNDAAHGLRLFRSGVDAIITDYPDRLLAALQT